MRTHSIVRSLSAKVSSRAAILKTGLSGRRHKDSLCRLLSLVSSVAVIMKTGLQYQDRGIRTRSMLCSLLSMVSSVAAILKTANTRKQRTTAFTRPSNIRQIFKKRENY
jgi:hypothetical protein